MAVQCLAVAPAFLCELIPIVKEQAISAGVGLVVGGLVAIFGATLALLNPKTWKYAGRWNRYGLSFYKNGKTRHVHKAKVYVIPFPPFIVVISLNKTYSYVGSISIGSTIYIYWKGIFHSERMLSVFQEPLIVNSTTVMVGVKSCITKFGEPASNKEIMSRQPLDDVDIQRAIGGEGSHLIVSNGTAFSAAYEVTTHDPEIA